MNQISYLTIKKKKTEIKFYHLVKVINSFGEKEMVMTVKLPKNNQTSKSFFFFFLNVAKTQKL